MSITSNMSIVEKSQECHRNAIEHGWYDGKTYHDTKMSLVVGEVIEAMEVIIRSKENDQCNKNIGLTNIEEEIADVYLRLLDYIGYLGYKSFIHYDSSDIRNNIKRLLKGKSDGEMIGQLIKSIVTRFQTGSGYDYLLAMVEEYAIIKGINLEHAVTVKHEYNKTRPHKHGGKKF